MDIGKRIAEKLVHNKSNITLIRLEYIIQNILPCMVKEVKKEVSKEEFFKVMDSYIEKFSIEKTDAAREIRYVIGVMQNVVAQVEEDERYEKLMEAEKKKREMKGATIADIMKAKGMDLQGMVKK